MDDLVTWLRAQLDDDERVALAASPGPWGDTETGAPHWSDAGVYDVNDQSVALYDAAYEEGPTSIRAEDATHIARHDPVRVLREVAAKRAIVEWVVNNRVPNSTIGDSFAYALFALAAVYSDRDGYRTEWAPA